MSLAQRSALPQVATDGKKFYLDGNDLSFLFINAGNRTAVVKSVTFWAMQPKEDPYLTEPNCKDESFSISTESLDGTFEPLVLKPSEIALGKATIPETRKKEIALRQYNQESPRFYFEICLLLTFIYSLERDDREDRKYRNVAGVVR